MHTQYRHSDTGFYWLFSAPALLIYSAIIIAPTLYSLILSFFRWSGTGKPVFIGFKNYIQMFGAPEFQHALYNNFAIVLTSIFIQIPLGFLLAWILYRRLVAAPGLFQSLIFFPVIISPVVVAILFKTIFTTGGLLEALIARLSDNPLYMLSSFQGKYTAIIPVLLVIIWMYAGLYMIIFLANLQKISPEIIEAAIVDGAGEWQVIKNIAFPALVPIFVTSSIYAISGSLKSFDLIYVMTGGGPSYYTEVLASYMYQSTFAYNYYGYGAAITVIIVVLSIGLIYLLTAIANKFIARYA
ncbi:MAG: carbohydrate ABC transporter permease [Alphaproteobacteria bacterium]